MMDDKNIFCNLNSIKETRRLKSFSRPFTVPPGYFDDLPLIIIKKLQPQIVNEELQEIAPSLQNISKLSPFTVPKHYFKDLSATGQFRKKPLI